MPRDKALEALINDALGPLPGLTQKGMFGGWAWLLHGNLLCAARTNSMMIRLGRENEPWALEISGITPTIMRGRRMHGWVRVAPEAYGHDELRDRLLKAALEFNRTLPKK
ncbi:TfoX/Sxy family protein [Occallatibacter riparius]|uniref:TfoX/Sxy family protein n=1 Tax=Occallatibacter riparius TaxID=1002689 RepID=A0A9J7BN71_9BACT|nr:TfoX/Sxy family protein [Occallatibacter riparius]UWZ83953.1 TfoX/Sxy family protein [Occallatibacter riparius]